MLALPPQTTPPAPPARPMAPRAQTRVSAAVAETVTVTPALSESRTHLLKPAEAWGWPEVRDYVVTSIEERFGAFPRDQRREYGIFQRFAKDYGPDAGPIAVYAFETCDGWWMGATVSVNRFCRGSDPYFAQPILDRLHGAA